MSDIDLFSTFIDLHEKLSDRGISIILGGGLGLYLKQLYLMEKPVRTLIERANGLNHEAHRILTFSFRWKCSLAWMK
jgi:hypothetical protein